MPWCHKKDHPLFSPVQGILPQPKESPQQSRTTQVELYNAIAAILRVLRNSATRLISPPLPNPILSPFLIKKTEFYLLCITTNFGEKDVAEK